MKPPRPFLVAAALLVALAGAAVAGVVAHATSAVTTVKVTEKEYKITVTGKPTAGADRFVIKNTGHLTHALVISGPGVKSKKTPLIKPGKSFTLSVTLKSGKYSIWCPEPGHAAEGMKAAFRIGTVATGGGGYGGASTTTDTSTTDGGPAWG